MIMNKTDLTRIQLLNDPNPKVLAERVAGTEIKLQIQPSKYIHEQELIFRNVSMDAIEQIVLLSYGVPIACLHNEIIYRTDQRWSKTTKRHCNEWVALHTQILADSIKGETLETVRTNRVWVVSQDVLNAQMYVQTMVWSPVNG